MDDSITRAPNHTPEFYSPIFQAPHHDYLRQLGLKVPAPQVLSRLTKPADRRTTCIVFTDPGIDDFLALATLYHHFDNLILVACGGNTRSRQIIDNCRVVRDSLGLNARVMEGVPSASAEALATAINTAQACTEQTQLHDASTSPDYDHAEEVHGKAGLGPFDSEALTAKITGPEAEKWDPQALLAIIEAQPETTIFSLAPTQDLRVLLELVETTNAALGRRLRIIMMGLALDQAQANSKNNEGQLGEFNAIFDYSATQAVFAQCERLHITLQLVPADLTHQRQALWHRTHLNALSALAKASGLTGLRMLTEIYTIINEKNTKAFQWAYDDSGYPPSPVHDAAAILSLLDPSQFTGTRIGLALQDDGSIHQTEGDNVIAVDTLPTASEHNIADGIVSQLRKNYDTLIRNTVDQTERDAEQLTVS